MVEPQLQIGYVNLIGPQNTHFEKYTDSTGEERLSIDTAYGYGFSIPFVDFRAVVEQIIRERDMGS